MGIVISGSVTRTNMKISAIDGTAFVDFSAAGVLTDYLGVKLTIIDSAGKEIVGYIKAAGTGETTSTLYTADFSADLDGWGISWEDGYAGSGSLVWDTDHAVLTTLSDGTTSYRPIIRKHNIAGMVVGSLHFFELDYTLVSGSSHLKSNFIGNVDGNSALFDESLTGTDTYISKVMTSSGATYYNDLFMYFDGKDYTGVLNITGVRVKKVLTPSATGVTIVSTAGGSTYNWASKETGFNYYDASGYTYEILLDEDDLALSAYGILSADQVSRLIQPPAFRAYGILSTDWQIQLLPPPLSAITYLRAMNAAIFADRGYWITYACVLSGTPELFLPMSSFRAELRADGVSHLTVNVPGDEYYEAVALRVPVEISDAEKETLDGYPDLGNYDPYAPAGRWVWYYNHINYPYGYRVGGYKWVEDEVTPLITPPPPSPQKEAELGRLSVYMIKNYFTGEQQGTLLAEVDLSEVHYARDAVTKGIVLAGYKEKIWTPKTAHVTGAQYQSIIGGKYRYRCVPGYNINPGDTVIMEDGNTFIAGLITWLVSPGQEIMELTEAELESYL